MGKRLKNYLYIAPAILFLLLFTLYPIIRSVYLSFFETDSVFSFLDFVGLQHYREMLGSKLRRFDAQFGEGRQQVPQL